MDDPLNQHHHAALALLPPLTRAVYLLAALDDLSSRDIAWRCGIDVAEVELRLADGLLVITRVIDGRVTTAMRMRPVLLTPWRADLARWRLWHRHRSMGIR